MMSIESLASTLEKTPKTPKDADPWKAHKILAKFVLYRLSPNLSKVVLRRLVSGPKLPSWPFLFEVVMEAVGAQIKSNPISDIVHLREQVDSLIIPLPKEKYQVAKVNAGGVSALWIACRDVTKRMNFSALAGKSSVKAPASPSSPRGREEAKKGVLIERPQPRPGDKVLLYLHGGGYIAMSPNTHSKLIAQIAKRTGLWVLAPDYRLAPEHPFPAAIEDAVAAFQYLTAPVHEGGIGVYGKDIVILGDSAGGGLTTACLLTLQQIKKMNGATVVEAVNALQAPLQATAAAQSVSAGNPSTLPPLELPLAPSSPSFVGTRLLFTDRTDLPGLVCLLSPFVDLTLSGDSHLTNAQFDYLKVDSVVIPQWYAGMRYSIEHPLISPVFANFQSFPANMFIQVGGKEVLHHDAVLLADKARKGGVKVDLEEWADMVHVHQFFAPVVPQGVDALRNLCHTILLHFYNHSSPHDAADIPPRAKL